MAMIKSNSLAYERYISEYNVIVNKIEEYASFINNISSKLVDNNTYIGLASSEENALKEISDQIRFLANMYRSYIQLLIINKDTFIEFDHKLANINKR